MPNWFRKWTSRHTITSPVTSVTANFGNGDVLVLSSDHPLEVRTINMLTELLTDVINRLESGINPISNQEGSQVITFIRNKLSEIIAYVIYAITAHSTPVVPDHAYKGRYVLSMVDLAYCGGLHDGWNGVGSRHIARGVLSTAYMVCRILEPIKSMPIPSVNPSADGTLDIRWADEHGVVRMYIGKVNYNWAYVSSDGNAGYGGEGGLHQLIDHPEVELRRLVQCFATSSVA